MSDFQLKMQTKRIQHLDRVMLTSRMDDIDNMLRELTIIKPSCVVIDSLQKWAGESNGKQLECVEKFYKWAKKTFIPVIMIGHVNKDGKYKGPSSVLHEIDTHVHMYRDTDTLEVVLSVGKTRFGGHITPLPFSIEPVGLRIGSRYFTPEGERSVADLMKDQGLPGVEDFKTGPYDDKKFETAAKQVIEFLKEEYREEFKRKRKSADKTIIRFRDVKDTYCKSDNSVIQFGLKTIRSWKPGIKSKYAGENFIFDKFCRTHQDNAMEVVCHEFTHLFGYSKHNKEFFTKLVEVCKKVRFAFSDPSLV
jgi:hypothetical protein